MTDDLKKRIELLTARHQQLLSQEEMVEDIVVQNEELKQKAILECQRLEKQQQIELEHPVQSGSFEKRKKEVQDEFSENIHPRYQQLKKKLEAEDAYLKEQRDLAEKAHKEVERAEQQQGNRESEEKNQTARLKSSQKEIIEKLNELESSLNKAKEEIEEKGVEKNSLENDLLKTESELKQYEKELAGLSDIKPQSQKVSGKKENKSFERKSRELSKIIDKTKSKMQSYQSEEKARIDSIALQKQQLEKKKEQIQDAVDSEGKGSHAELMKLDQALEQHQQSEKEKKAEYANREKEISMEMEKSFKELKNNKNHSKDDQRAIDLEAKIKQDLAKLADKQEALLSEMQSAEDRLNQHREVLMTEKHKVTYEVTGKNVQLKQDLVDVAAQQANLADKEMQLEEKLASQLDKFKQQGHAEEQALARHLAREQHRQADQASAMSSELKNSSSKKKQIEEKAAHVQRTSTETKKKLDLLSSQLAKQQQWISVKSNEIQKLVDQQKSLFQQEEEVEQAKDVAPVKNDNAKLAAEQVYQQQAQLVERAVVERKQLISELKIVEEEYNRLKNQLVELDKEQNDVMVDQNSDKKDRSVKIQHWIEQQQQAEDFIVENKEKLKKVEKEKKKLAKELAKLQNKRERLIKKKGKSAEKEDLPLNKLAGQMLTHFGRSPSRKSLDKAEQDRLSYEAIVAKVAAQDSSQRSDDQGMSEVEHVELDQANADLAAYQNFMQSKKPDDPTPREEKIVGSQMEVDVAVKERRSINREVEFSLEKQQVDPKENEKAKAELKASWQAEAEAAARKAQEKMQIELKAKQQAEAAARKAEEKAQAELKAKQQAKAAVRKAEEKAQAELKAKQQAEEATRKAEKKSQAEFKLKQQAEEASRKVQEEVQAEEASRKAQKEAQVKLKAQQQAEAEEVSHKAKEKKQAKLKAKQQAEAEYKARKQAESDRKSEEKAEEKARAELKAQQQEDAERKEKEREQSVETEKSQKKTLVKKQKQVAREAQKEIKAEGAVNKKKQDERQKQEKKTLKAKEKQQKIEKKLTAAELSMRGAQAESSIARKVEDEDIDFIADSKNAVISEKLRWSSSLLYGIIIFLVVITFWAYLAMLDEIASGSGKVVPTSQVQVIQNLEGGIVSEILVTDGEEVKEGQILVKLDDTRFGSQFRENWTKYLSLLGSMARLDAQLKGLTKISFPDVVIKEDPSSVANETNLFETQNQQLSSNVETLQQNYDLAVEELKITEPLVEEGLMSKLELLRLRREVNELEGEISALKDTFITETQGQFNEQKAELDVLAEQLKALKDRQDRTFVASPVNGIVKSINIKTLGGVIKPGQDIMEIVPTDDKLLIEAKINPSDIAFIHKGQDAKIKISAYDFSIYGSLAGRVILVSPDTIEEEVQGKEKSYYKIYVRTDQNYIERNGVKNHIKIGMTVSVDVLTGKKSVLDYILKPFLKAQQSALRER